VIASAKAEGSLKCAHTTRIECPPYLRLLARKNGDRVIQRGSGYVLVDGLSGEVVFPVTATQSTQVGATLLEITNWMGVELR